MPRPESKLGIEPKVYLEDTESAFVRCLSASRRCGSGELDSAQLYVDTGNTSDPMLNVAFRDWAQPLECAIMIGQRVIHWGMIAETNGSLTERGVGMSLTSRLDKQHFGSPLSGWWTLQHTASGTRQVFVTYDAVFNPLVDGRIVPNMTEDFANALSGQHKGGFHHMIHPESLRSMSATIWNAKRVERWTIATAVHFLCRVLNPFETYIKNPVVDALNKNLPSDDGLELINNVRIPIGTYLPQALDMLLDPIDCAWCIEHETRKQRRIRVFQRGTGSKVTLRHQKAGQVFDPGKSEAHRIQVRYDPSGRRLDDVVVFGDFEEVESTFELMKGWPLDDDAVAWAKLKWDHPEWVQNPERQFIWRKWVLNEGGDYVTVGNTTFRQGVDGPYDLSAIFPGGYVPRRRKFLPTLTMIGDKPAGQYNGIVVEIWVVDNDGGAWHPLHKYHRGGVQLLDDECGILITGDMPPAVFQMNQTDAKVRVTATIRGDRRLASEVRAAATFGGPRIGAVIDASHRFRKRRVHSESIYYDLIADGTLESAAVDDTKKVKKLAQHMVDIWNRADLAGTATLDGLEFAGALGDVVTSIYGRNVDFSISPKGARPRYPEIVGIDYDIADQSTTIHFPSRRPQRPPLVSQREAFQL